MRYVEVELHFEFLEVSIIDTKFGKIHNLRLDKCSKTIVEIVQIEKLLKYINLFDYRYHYMTLNYNQSIKNIEIIKTFLEEQVDFPITNIKKIE